MVGRLVAEWCKHNNCIQGLYNRSPWSNEEPSIIRAHGRAGKECQDWWEARILERSAMAGNDGKNMGKLCVTCKRAVFYTVPGKTNDEAFPTLTKRMSKQYGAGVLWQEMYCCAVCAHKSEGSGMTTTFWQAGHGRACDWPGVKPKRTRCSC